MRWWFLGGGMRSFLAGYAGLPLLLGLLGAIVVAIHDRSAESLVIVLGVLLAYFLALLGLIFGIVRGFGLGWWGPWDGRLVFMGLMAGLVVLMIVGRWLENRIPVPNVPAACVVMARRAYRFPTTAWNRFIGRLVTVGWNQPIGSTLLVIAGAGFFCLGCAGLVLGRPV